MSAIKKRHCHNCNKDWYPRTPGRPVRCPRCKSQRYDDQELWAMRHESGKPTVTPAEFRHKRRRIKKEVA